MDTRERNYYASVARDFGYPKDTVRQIMNASSARQAEQLLTSARAIVSTPRTTSKIKTSAGCRFN